MAVEMKFDDLKAKYGNFMEPLVLVTVNGKDLCDTQYGLGITDVRVEVSAGYEASYASFLIANMYDEDVNAYKTDILKKVVDFGKGVSISIGYGRTVRNVFVGYVAGIEYYFRKNSPPGVRVTCLDVKGLMMGNKSSQQVAQAKYYSDAVKLILDKYENLKKTKPEAISKVTLFDSPDKDDQNLNSKDENPVSFEMVEETDYEFCVKAAKKFNYEFFVFGGEVVFRKAKSNEDVLLALGFEQFNSISAEYCTVGLTGSVEVRAINPSDGKQIKAVEKATRKGLNSYKKVYIDPTITTENEAKFRAQYLMEANSYKFGTLNVEMVGLPEITPGRFIQLIIGKGTGFTKWYVQKVEHIMDGTKGYTTRFLAKACDDTAE